jgi:N-formylglutamate deformylase
MEDGMIRSVVELKDEQNPILALAIHNGHEMHPELLNICGISAADRLREEDPFTEVFTEPYPNRIVVYTSRFTVDLNRKRENAVYLSPEDCWGLPARTTRPSDELVTELGRDYGQWYSLLTFTIQRLLAKHSFLTILDLHSFNHRRQGQGAAPDPQQDNPDIILGRNNMPKQYYAWVDGLCSELNNKDVMGHRLDCRIDIKFTGGSLSRWLHQTFPGKVACLAVEFKKIFMDEWTGTVNNEFQVALSRQFAKAIEACR